MAEKKKILISLAEKKEIPYSVTRIKRTKKEDIDAIWDEVQKDRLTETNVFIAETFVEKLCDILESTNIIENGEETSIRLKNRKAFMNDMQNIAGRTGSGKTRLLLKILEDEFMDLYDDVFLICPTYKQNFCYQNWEFKDLKNWHPISCNIEDVNYVLSLVSKNIKGKTLIILDDCASSKEMSLQKSNLTKLAQGGRHYQINTIVITQQITSIAKAYRDNITRVITFFNPSKSDRDILFNTMCSHKKSEEETIMKTLMKNKYSYFDVHLYHPWTCEVILQNI